MYFLILGCWIYLKQSICVAIITFRIALSLDTEKIYSIQHYSMDSEPESEVTNYANSKVRSNKLCQVEVTSLLEIMQIQLIAAATDQKVGMRNGSVSRVSRRIKVTYYAHYTQYDYYFIRYMPLFRHWRCKNQANARCFLLCTIIWCWTYQVQSCAADILHVCYSFPAKSTEPHHDSAAGHRQ